MLGPCRYRLEEALGQKWAEPDPSSPSTQNILTGCQLVLGANKHLETNMAQSGAWGAPVLGPVGEHVNAMTGEGGTRLGEVWRLGGLHRGGGNGAEA